MQNNTFFADSKPSNVIVLEKTTSTNDYLKELWSKFKPLPNFTVIMAKRQENGKGQRGNQWLAEPLKNMTSSYLLIPKELQIYDAFYLTMVSSIAAYAVIKQITNKKVCIKWPNDILIDNKKIAGILIENKIKGTKIESSIIGIGINVFQEQFNEEIAYKTTSLILENSETNLTILDLTILLQNKIKQYSTCKLDELLAIYNENLFQKDENKLYEIKGKLVEGKILAIEHDGLLRISINKEIIKFDLKDIVYRL